MTQEQILKEKELIISQIKKYCPTVSPFFDLDTKLKDYSDSLYDFEISKTHLRRQELAKAKIRKKLKELFGDNYEQELELDLDGKLAFNIADHHQVLNHPLLMTANLISHANRLFQTEKGKAIIVISSGDVPPNNYFSKNGFQLHGKRVPIFSTSERELTSYYIPKRDFNFIEKLKVADRWKEFNQEEQEFLLKEFEKIKSFDYSKCKNYSDQITIIVKNTWPYIFEEKLRPNLPELLYLTQEEMTTECLIDLLKDDDNIISKCLFDKKFRDKVLDNFRGIVVTWREKEGKGTHFFWRKYPGRSQSLRMYIKDNKLVPIDKRFKDYAIALDKDTIIDLLEKREIYPSLFMIFSVLNFYAGVKPLVGFGSLIYLDLIKKAWIKTLTESNLKDEVKLVEQVQTNGYIAGLTAFFKKFNGELKTLYAYDIFYEGGTKIEYLNKLFEMKFKDLNLTSIAGMYDYYGQKYIPSKEQIKPKITFEDLAKLVFKWV